MGSTQSVPPAFELTVVDGRHLLSLPAAGRAVNATTPGSWLSLQRLVLDAGASINGAGAATDGPSAATAQGPVGALRNRRTRLRGATLEISLEQLNRALAAIPLIDAGIFDARVWMAPGGPRLTGTFVAGNRRAPFTIRPSIEPRVDGRRRLRIVLSDVRVYGSLPLPASLIGVALARAIGAGIPDAGPAVRGFGPNLDVDPLALALEQTLVASGWRLPDLAAGWLEAIDAGGGPGGLRLRFGGDGHPTDRFAALDGGDAAVGPQVEGERLPESALAAEERLNAGDLLAAETAFRLVVRESPRARPVRARLLALRVAAGGADVRELAAAMVAEWPDFVPGLLGAAIAARAAGDPERAAEAFGRVAALCEHRDEREDANLARAAEAEARAAAEHIRHAPVGRPPVTEAPETTQQDHEPPSEAPDVATTVEAPETTQQDADSAKPPAAAEPPSPAPKAPGLTDQTEQAIARGDLAHADTLFARRLESARDANDAAALIAERARVQLMGPDGAKRALATLRDVDLGVMPEEGLVLRADLAERVGDLGDARATLAELMARAVAAGDATHARQLASRQAELAAPTPEEASGPIAADEPDEPELALPPPAEDAQEADDAQDVESGVPAQALASDSSSVTGRTEAVYAAEGDADTRTQALGELLEAFETLEPDRQHAAYASFGRVAESTGDLEHAEEAYWRATRVAGDPERRASDLLAHARVLISRGNVAAAAAELEEALGIVPNHAGALAMLAEQAFHSRDWERARHLYALLDGAPGAAEAIPRETLVYRRAVLARAVGDLSEAEACYRELALLSPRHIEARQALAEMAIARDDPRTAADRWEEVLRLLPLDALDALLDVRQRLADVYVRLTDWGSARYYAELVLAQDPGRIAMLERMAEIDERLGLFPAAVQVLDRLARMYIQPRKRAEALFRQGEILLERMNDPTRAFEAHLKASDLDPAFTPTALRLIEGYWRAGDFGEAADVGDELRRAGPLPDLSPLLRLQWTLAGALGRQDPARAMEATQLATLPWNAELAATGLAEAAALLAKRPPHELEPATAVIEAWSSQDPAAHEAETTADWLRAALRAQVMKDPAAPGAARALGWIADRKGDPLAARTWFSAVVFQDDGDGAAGRLDELGRAPAPTEAGLDLLGPAEHPDAGGSSAPLRRALAALAHGLAGFTGSDARAESPEGGAAGEEAATESSSPVSVDVQDQFATLARALGAPETTLVPVSEGNVRVAGGRPHRLQVPSSLLGIPRDELTFLVAQALDRTRSGLTLVDLATDGKAESVGSVLQGAAAALAAGDDPVAPEAVKDDLALRVANALIAPERLMALLQAPGGASATLELDLDHGTDVLAVWDTFRAGAQRACDRFAALACRNPLAALRALYRSDTVLAPGADELSEPERRISFLRTGRVRDLLRFLSSPEYARSVGVTSDDGPG